MSLVADTQLYEALSVHRSVGPLVRRSGVIELKSGKTGKSAPAHPSITGIGRVSGPMDVGDATSTTSMDVVKVGLEIKVGLELGMILC